MDAREAWLAATLAAYIDSPTDKSDILAQLTASPSHPAVVSFLDGSKPLLHVCIASGGGQATVTATNTPSNDSSSWLAFVKAGAQELTATSMSRNVLVTTSAGSTEGALYRLLHNVYLPMLSQPGAACTSTAQSALQRLDDALRSTQRGSAAQGSLGSAQTPLEEVRGPSKAAAPTRPLQQARDIFTSML